MVDIRIYLLSALRIANADILPFDWTATCDEFLATIAEYQIAAGGLADLAPARAATEALKQALARLPDAAPDRRNAVLHELSRVLVPINYTREPRFRHDPAYTVPKLPTLAVAADLAAFGHDHMRRVALTELMRGQNRYRAAIEQATPLGLEARACAGPPNPGT